MSKRSAAEPENQPATGKHAAHGNAGQHSQQGNAKCAAPRQQRLRISALDVGAQRKPRIGRKGDRSSPGR